MSIKNKILLYILILLVSPVTCYALTRFPRGTCNLEGFLVKAINEPNWYFIVNPRTNSETRFRLRSIPTLNTLSERGQFIEAIIDIPVETFSLYGEADLKQVKKFLNPYIDSKQYGISEVRGACEPGRYPNSFRKPTKKKLKL